LGFAFGFDFEIEYIKTESFGQADALSRFIQEARQGIDPEMEKVASLQEGKTEVLMEGF